MEPGLEPRPSRLSSDIWVEVPIDGGVESAVAVQLVSPANDLDVVW
jgi:hypothetical protein